MNSETLCVGVEANVVFNKLLDLDLVLEIQSCSVIDGQVLHLAFKVLIGVDEQDRDRLDVALRFFLDHLDHVGAHLAFL